MVTAPWPPLLCVVVTALLFQFPTGPGTGDDAFTARALAPPLNEVLSNMDSLELRLDLPSQVQPGKPVLITLHVRNTTDRQLTLYLRGRTIAFDLVITRADGTPVWSRLKGEVIPAILRVEMLAPGASLALEHSWDQRSDVGALVPSGTYDVRGEVLTDREPLITPTLPLGILPD